MRASGIYIRAPKASGNHFDLLGRASHDENNSPAQPIRQTKSTSPFQDVPSCLNFYSVFKERLKFSTQAASRTPSSERRFLHAAKQPVKRLFDFFSKSLKLTFKHLLGGLPAPVNPRIEGPSGARFLHAAKRPVKCLFNFFSRGLNFDLKHLRGNLRSH